MRFLSLQTARTFEKSTLYYQTYRTVTNAQFFRISLCAKSGFQNLNRDFSIESTNTLLSSVGCSFHSVTCVALNIKYHSLNDFTTHNVFLTRELRAYARASYRYDVGDGIRSLDWSIPVNFF